jgi:hypothetical protein
VPIWFTGTSQLPVEPPLMSQSGVPPLGSARLRLPDTKLPPVIEPVTALMSASPPVMPPSYCTLASPVRRVSMSMA